MEPIAGRFRFTREKTGTNSHESGGSLALGGFLRCQLRRGDVSDMVAVVYFRAIRAGHLDLVVDFDVLATRQFAGGSIRGCGGGFTVAAASRRPDQGPERGS